MGKRGLLITGAGGFLGKYIVDQYLRNYPNYTLYLLEHGPFLERLNTYLQTTYPDIDAARIHVFEGDITQPGLSIDDSMRDVLKDTVYAAIHLAAAYHLAIPRDIAFRVNVDGTQHVLDFCQDLPHLERFAHFSTMAIAGNYTGVFDESDFDVGQSFKNYYEETKFLSEKLVRERMPQFPACIFRPAIVIGHSKTGAIDKIDGPYYLFVAISRHLNWVLPDGGTILAHYAPVDFVTEGMVVLFEKDPDNIGRTFMLMDPNPLTLNEFVDLICRHWPKSPPLLRVPHSWMKPLARLPLFELISGIPWQAFQYGGQDIKYTMPETTRRLAALGIRCPSPTEYMPLLIKYFKEHFRDKNIRRGKWDSLIKP